MYTDTNVAISNVLLVAIITEENDYHSLRFHKIIIWMVLDRGYYHFRNWGRGCARTTSPSHPVIHY